MNGLNTMWLETQTNETSTAHCAPAIYFHCYARRLNLVIAQAVKSVVSVADLFAALQLCCFFLSGFIVH